MQSAAVETPTGKQRVDSAVVKSNGKKLVQARLPFKIIAAGSDKDTTPVAKEVPKSSATAKDGRKRRLSFDAAGKECEQDQSDEVVRGRSASKENLLISAKKKRLTDEPEEVVVLDDDDNIIEDEEDAVVEEKMAQEAVSPKTPKPSAAATNKGKGKGSKKTPNSAKSKSKHASGGSASKVQIKLPLSGGLSNKRRKSKFLSSAAESTGDDETDMRIVSSDDTEANTNELNPQKRQKVDDSADKNASVKMGDVTDLESDVCDIKSTYKEKAKNVINKRSPDASKEINTELKNPTDIAKEQTNCNEQQTNETADSKEIINIKHTPTKVNENSDVMQVSNDESAPADMASKQCTEIVLTSSDTNESTPVVKEVKENTKMNDVKVMDSPTTNAEAQKKSLTPKQQRLMEQRRKAREEKERRLQEERLQKQREKEEKELSRKREREERDEQRRKEREEREEVKRKDREEKERKRLAEVEAKNEEKRKRTEAKEEELRKKEEERKRKEQEKEEANMKVKKTAEAFQKFFKPKRSTIGTADAQQENSTNGLKGSSNTVQVLAFRPFEIKGDMTLAPICRKRLSFVARQEMDASLCLSTDDTHGSNEEISPTELYLAELKSGKVTPGRWRQPSLDAKETDDDVQILEDDLERAGLAIVEETHAPIERFRTKFYKFWENRRPPYYGTWSKKTNVITPRRPFAQDKNYFDYEIDSDLEWEEEEPGESLDGSDEDKEKESEDDDYEVDNEWFVPHGHLSEEELQNDEDAADANSREAQKAKLQVLQQEFAQEMKKKTEKIKPRLIGCIWVDENGNQPDICPKLIWDTLNIRSMWCAIPPLLEDPEIPEKTEPGSPSTSGMDKTTEKVKPINLSDHLLKDLVRLVHGNAHSKNFIIKEFLSYLEANEDSIKSGKYRLPPKSLVREKIEDFAEWTIVESKVVHSNKKKNKKRLCWVVSADVLNKMDLNELGLHNRWHYTLEPRLTGADKKQCEENVANDLTSRDDSPGKVLSAKDNSDKQANGDKRSGKVKPKQKRLKKLMLSEPEPHEAGTIRPQEDIDTSNADETEPKQKANGKSATANTVATAPSAPVAKRRVPLLMSVARGQQIPQPAKNALISEYLKKNTAEQKKRDNKTTPSNDVIMLE